MDHSRLQEDLLREFKQEKDLIHHQLELLDPLAVSLRKPVATRLFNNIMLLILEALAYLSIIAVIAFCIIRDKVYPFYILARLRHKGSELGFSDRDMNSLYWSPLLFASLIVILLFILARNLSQFRRKNKVLQLAARQIKVVVEEQLKRKAAIDTIDQRHFGILEPLPVVEPKATEVSNPGY